MCLTSLISRDFSAWSQVNQNGKADRENQNGSCHFETLSFRRKILRRQLTKPTFKAFPVEVDRAQKSSSWSFFEPGIFELELSSSSFRA